MLKSLRSNLAAMNVSEGGEEVLNRNRWARGAVLFGRPGPTDKARQQVWVEYCSDASELFNVDQPVPRDLRQPFRIAQGAIHSLLKAWAPPRHRDGAQESSIADRLG